MPVFLSFRFISCVLACRFASTRRVDTSLPVINNGDGELFNVVAVTNQVRKFWKRPLSAWPVMFSAGICSASWHFGFYVCWVFFHEVILTQRCGLSCPADQRIEDVTSNVSQVLLRVFGLYFHCATISHATLWASLVQRAHIRVTQLRLCAGYAKC